MTYPVVSDLDAGNDSLLLKPRKNMHSCCCSLGLPATQQLTLVCIPGISHFSNVARGDDRMSPFLYDAAAITLLAAFVSVVVCFLFPVTLRL